MNIAAQISPTSPANATASGTTKSFLFDVKLLASIRIQAKDEREARALLEGVLDCADVNFGSLPDGTPVTGEASADGEADLVDE